MERFLKETDGTQNPLTSKKSDLLKLFQINERNGEFLYYSSLFCLQKSPIDGIVLFQTNRILILIYECKSKFIQVLNFTLFICSKK